MTGKDANIEKEIDDIELRSEDVQEVLGQTPSWILRRGIFMLTVFVAVLLAGSWFFKYPQVVNATITLTSQNPPANIVAKTSGAIADIYVKDGQKVRAGQRLVLIDNPAVVEDIDSLASELERITAATNDMKIYHIRNTRMKLGSMQSDFSTMMLKLDNYNQFITLNYYPQKIAASQKLLEICRRQTTSALRQQTIVNKQHELQKKNYNRSLILHDKGLISDEDFEQAGNTLLQIELNVANATDNVTNNRSQQLQISSEITELKQQYAEQLSNILTDMKSSVNQLVNDIATWRMTYLITSPVNGTVTFTNFWARNQNVESGKVVFSVVPSHAPVLIGKVQLPALGAGRVRKNQRVNVSFDNFPEKEFGTVKGVVRRISLIPTDENNYVVEVGFPDGLKTSYGKRLPVSQEMSGSASIITEDTRLIEQLLQPVKKVLYENT